MSSSNALIIRPTKSTKQKNVPEPELQWLESGIDQLLGLTFKLFVQTFVVLLSGIIQLIAALSKKRP